MNLIPVFLGAGLPQPEPEFKFHPQRRWRFDYAWEAQRVALEIEGVVYRGAIGRHQRATGYENDCEKYAEALALGWRVLRVTPAQIQSGKAIAWLEKLLLEQPS